jgi:hypothetical protein
LWASRSFFQQKREKREKSQEKMECSDLGSLSPEAFFGDSSVSLSRRKVQEYETQLKSFLMDLHQSGFQNLVQTVRFYEGKQEG